MKTLLKGNHTKINDLMKVVIVSIVAVLFCGSNLMGMSDATEILLTAINDEEFVSKSAKKDLHLVNGSKLVFDELLRKDVPNFAGERIRNELCRAICLTL